MFNINPHITKFFSFNILLKNILLDDLFDELMADRAVGFGDANQNIFFIHTSDRLDFKLANFS